MDFRIEKDSMGEIKVANDKVWGAQTQRQLCPSSKSNPWLLLKRQRQ